MMDLVLKNLGGEIARERVKGGDTPGHRLLELLESNEWVLEAGDTVEVVENWSEED